MIELPCYTSSIKNNGRKIKVESALTHEYNSMETH